MGKKILIIVVLFLVSSLGAWGFEQEMSESEDLMLKQKYEVLDQLNVEELKNMSSESFNSIRNLFNEYLEETNNEPESLPDFERSYEIKINQVVKDINTIVDLNNQLKKNLVGRFR